MQYRLKKWYPTLPKNWEVGMIVGTGSFVYYPINDKYEGSYIPCSEVENNPEFWEKVEEKSYEILSYIHTITNSVYSKIKEEVFITSNGWSLPQPLENHANIIINSVKRLSDNEIFTLGDAVDGISHRSVKINSIESNPNCNQIMFNRLDEGIDLSDARKVKQPLFTTNDGVDIYLGDSFYYIDNKWKLCHYIVYNDSSFIYSVKKTSFSTKEAAEEYIIMNKPCLSINEVLNAMVGVNILRTPQLVELVKSKS